MKECFWQSEFLEVFWQQVSFLGYFLYLREFLFFLGERGNRFLREVFIAYLRLNDTIIKKLSNVSEGCSSLKIDINRLRKASQYHDVNGLGAYEDKIKTETLFRHVSILTSSSSTGIFWQTVWICTDFWSSKIISCSVTRRLIKFLIIV